MSFEGCMALKQKSVIIYRPKTKVKKKLNEMDGLHEEIITINGNFGTVTFEKNLII